MPKIKVAVCISGQMRGFEKAAPSLIENIIRPLEADVFIHTWSEIGSSVNEHKRKLPSPIVHYLPPELDERKDKMEEVFPYFMKLIAEDDRVDTDKIKSLYNPLNMVVEDSPHLDEFDRFFGFRVPQKLMEKQPKVQWSRPLFYKIWKCNELKLQEETRRGFKYDLVIRVRPDLSIGAAISYEHLQRLDKLYHRIRTIDTSYQVADQYFYGASKIMDYVCSAFRRIPKIWNEYERSNRSHKYYWAEGLLGTHLSNNPNIELIPFRTEKASHPSKFQLLSYSGNRLKLFECYDELKADISSVAKSELKERLTVAASRALANDIKYMSNPLCSKQEGALIESKVKEFEKDYGASPHFAASRIAKHKGNTKLSKSCALKAHNQEPKSAEILIHLAELYYASKDYAYAIKFASLATKLDDEYGRENRAAVMWKPFSIIGMALEIQGDYKAALNSFMRAASLNPNHKSSFYRTGKMLFYLGEYDQCLLFLGRALEINDKHDAADYFLAHALVKLGANMDAQAIVSKYVSSDLRTSGNTTKFLGPLALLQFSRNKKADAEKVLDAYLSRNVYHDVEVVELTKMLISLERLGDAKKFALQGFDKFKQSNFVKDGIGWFLGE